MMTDDKVVGTEADVVVGDEIIDGQLSEEAAVNLLNEMTPEQIANFMKLANTHEKPWAGKHHAARAARAKARVAKRKAMR